MTIIQPKRTIAVPESAYGVCLWEMPHGGCLGDGDHFLSLEGPVGDKRVEAKMRKHIIHYLGEDVGKPKWISGGRKVTDIEFDVQNERFENGLIPDEYDAAQQVMRRSK